MFESIVRTTKGALMGALYGVFFLGILCELFVFLPGVSILNRLFGQQPYRMQWALRSLLNLWLWFLWGCRLLVSTPSKGVPVEGPCVVVSNHPGLFDVLFLIREIPRMCVMVKRVLTRNLPLGPLFRSAGYVLSPDYEHASPLQSLDEAAEKIQKGYKFMVFPESTRSPKGGLGRFSPGPFMLARRSNVPVQPVFIRNQPPFLPKEDRWYFPPFHASTIQLEYWEPLVPPGAGEEREFAKKLEARYREALSLREGENLESSRESEWRRKTSLEPNL
jgi:1-acyl-sn-glycerol-3-phosphate acyltransferase